MAVTVPRRPYPMGRDRLGILGGPVGAAAALSDTDAEYTIGTNDFIVEATVNVKWITNAAADSYLIWCSDGAVDWYFHLRQTMIGIWIDGNSYLSTAVENMSGRTVHVMVFCDRSGNAYYYLDGAYVDSDDISAKSGSALDGTVLNVGGTNGANQRCDACQMARLFILSGAFPTAGEMAAIAAERFVNPDAESPTLALRAAYATERRLDVDFVDIDQDGTTVTNNGTGGALTIGGGLNWYAVRTQAERTAIVTPEEDWYIFDETHLASNGAADLGCVQGSYVLEALVRDTIYPITNQNIYQFRNAGNTDSLQWRVNAVDQYNLQTKVDGGFTTTVLDGPGYSEYGRHGLHVWHQVYDADGNASWTCINGQCVDDGTPAADLDLSGNMALQIDNTLCRGGILGIRIWNSASLPADWATIIKRRVYNPWTVTDGFTGMTLRANYECRISDAIAQPVDSTVIKNQANPPTGDLTISGGGTLANSTVLAVRGL